jgi:hypothetical protein
MARKRKNNPEKATQIVIDELKELEDTVELEIAETSAIVSAIVANCAAVYLRPTPKKEGKPLSTLMAGQRVHIMEKGHEWSYVDVESVKKAGYIMNDFLKVVK